MLVYTNKLVSNHWSHIIVYQIRRTASTLFSKRRQAPAVSLCAVNVLLYMDISASLHDRKHHDRPPGADCARYPRPEM